MTILATWKTLQDLVDQFEQVVVKEKGKLLEAWIWSHLIQSLTKKFDALWFRNSKGSQKRKDCCHEPKKDDPSNLNTVNSLVSDHPWFTAKWLLTGGGRLREQWPK